MELMVVVAIIGILSAIAVPSFKKYSIKAKTTEAKLSLTNIFIGEQSAYSEWGTYVSCLWTVGVEGTSGLAYGSLDTNFMKGVYTRYYNAFVSGTPDDGNANWGNQYVRATYDPNCTHNAGVGPGCYIYAANVSSACKSHVDYVNHNVYTLDLASNGGVNPTLTQSTFNAYGYGYIGNCTYAGTDSKNIDIWSMNNTKQLRQLQVGY